MQWSYNVEKAAWFFNSIAGMGPYPIREQLTATPFLYTLCLLPMLLYCMSLSPQWLEKNEKRALGAWMLIALALQLVLFRLAPATLGDYVRSDGANTYYGVSRHFKLMDLMLHYRELLPSLPQHAHSNMPGKILFYYFLDLFTGSSNTMGFLTVVISNLGGIFMYLIGKRLFQDKEVGLYAMLLYLFTPVKTVYFPLLNVISPLLILWPFWLLLKYIDEKEKRHLFWLGLAVYLLFIFDPAPLILGLFFSAFLLRGVLEKKLNWATLAKDLPTVFLGFFVGYLAFLAVFRFEAFSTFKYVVENNSHFYEQYGFRRLWYLESLTSFFFNSGILISAFYLALFTLAFARLFVGRLSLKALSTADFAILVFFLNLMVLNFSGANRAEVPRYWIFMYPFLQMGVAYYLSKVVPRVSMSTVMALTALQTALTFSNVGFLLP